MERLILLTTLLALCACDSKDWESAGHQDGYAATVNTTCKFRATMVHGKFENAEYAKGYSRGAQEGAAAVARQGCERLK
ncbi:Uncharacterised protein [Xylophilus ampelinus]|nr:Uncharacterised protein [Xylophilus ampelinus]